MVKGVLGAFIVHLIGAAIAIGTSFMFTNSYDDAADTVKRDLDGSAMPEAEVLLDLGDAWAALFDWLLVGFAVGLICAILFLVASVRAKATTRKERAGLRGVWTILLLVNFFAMMAAWWFLVASPEATFAMVAGNYVTIMGISILTLLLSYYLGTALTVRKLMVPSVPVAQTIRGA